ncbi:hypothetical protein [Bradyrhizobium sp. ORS 86]|uniref:hypothetical protein n=1 Tax=Bradyrhizobium sp. ORS 86 TaxID=1685970 RepID=UPI0038905BCD
MSLLAENSSAELGSRLRDADATNAELMADIVNQTSRRFPSAEGGKAARVERLIEAGAWIDAALALIDLKLPQWQLRRLVYDEGQWHCALSRMRELPDWLDGAIETRHANLALAILSAFVEAQRIGAPSSRTSVPTVQRIAGSLYEPLCLDNFG